MTEEQWYYTRGGQRFGPIPMAALKSMASSGQLTPQDFVWRDGMPDWIAASGVNGLFAPAMPTQQFAPPTHPQQYAQPQDRKSVV